MNPNVVAWRLSNDDHTQNMRGEINYFLIQSNQNQIIKILKHEMVKLLLLIILKIIISMKVDIIRMEIKNLFHLHLHLHMHFIKVFLSY